MRTVRGALILRRRGPEVGGAVDQARLQLARPDRLPATLAKAELKFTRGAVVNSRWFPKCSPKRLEPHKRCPRGSLLGRAKIGAAVGPTTADMLAVPLTADLKGQAARLHRDVAVPARRAGVSARQLHLP